MRSSSPIIPRGMLKDPVTDPMLNLGNGLSELLGNGLTFERLDGVRVGSGWHDDECDDGDLGAHLLQAVVETWRWRGGGDDVSPLVIPK
jgi:hypothetical protein